MYSQIKFSTISAQFTKHANMLMQIEYDIDSGAAAGGVFVQVFDFPTPADLAAGNTAPAAGSIPLKSWPAAAGATDVVKEFKNGEMDFANGVFVCVSTTQATLTIGTGSNKFDSVAVELYNQDITGTTEVQQSGVGHAQIWSEANGKTHTYKLLRAVVVNLNATVTYAKLYAADVQSGFPILERALQATGDANGLDVGVFDFGVKNQSSLSGLVVMSQDSDGTLRVGCTIGGSTTPGSSQYSGSYNIYAEYK